MLHHASRRPGADQQRPSGGPALTIAAVLLGVLVVPMGMSGTSAALPRIGADLGGSGLQWVITGYFLAASCLMLVAGSLGDLLGRRLVLRIGAASYAASCLLAALAPSMAWLNIARGASGVGAAAIMASGAALLGATFEAEARTRVFAALGTTVGVGLAFGPTVSGWLVGWLDWRGMFAFFGMAGALVLAGTWVMQETRSDARPRLDLPGAAVFVVGMVSLMYGINQVSGAGWNGAPVLAPVAVGLAALALFVVLERRTREPLLALDLLRNPRLVAWLVAVAAMGAGTVGALIYLPTYLQGGTGLTAGGAGAVMLALTVPVLLVPPVAGRLVNTGCSPTLLIMVALALLAGGNWWLTVLAPGGPPAALLGPLVAIGIANGLAAGMIDNQALRQAPADRLGMASGLLNTVRSGTNAIGLAIFAALLTGLIRRRVGDPEVAASLAGGVVPDGDRADLLEQYTAAWQEMLWSVGALCAVSLVVVLVLLRRPVAGAPGDTPVPAPTTEAA